MGPIKINYYTCLSKCGHDYGFLRINLFAILHIVCLFRSVQIQWMVSNKWKNNEKLITPSSAEEQLAPYGSLQKNKIN